MTYRIHLIWAMGFSIAATLFGLFFFFASDARADIVTPPPPPPTEDEDGDGVLDVDDMCLGTVADAIDPNPNHHVWLGGDFFTTKDPKTKALVQSEYSVEDTAGCNCEQILKGLPGNRNGERKHGCAPGTMKNTT